MNVNTLSVFGFFGKFGRFLVDDYFYASAVKFVYIGGAFLFTSAEIAERIKALAKLKKVQLKDVLENSGMTKNAIVTMRAGSMPKADNLAKIAEQLDCSLDYLMGKTDDPTPPNQRVPLPEKEADRIVYEALKDTGLLGPDGLLTDEGAEVVARFLQQNADMLKKLMEP